jgi:methylthioribose-1-phosphate isomerase
LITTVTISAPSADGSAVEIIDQTRLPHAFVTTRLANLDDAAHAIRAMLVRGAPLIGASAAWGMWLALRQDSSDAGLAHAHATLLATRPTAVNLRWALDRVRAHATPLSSGKRAAAARELAVEICDEDVALNRGIATAGLPLIRAIATRKPAGTRVNILTHCNAGWLATVDIGTATAHIYAAHDAGIPVHVWVDETRPRNQGASLTAWELLNHGVPHTVIADNAAFTCRVSSRTVPNPACVSPPCSHCDSGPASSPIRFTGKPSPWKKETRASGSLATFASFKIFPFASTTHTLESSNDTSIPA